VTAAEVLGNIRAMTWALEDGATSEITLDRLLETHRRLLDRTRLAEHAGRVRTEQNWIGGSSHNPCSASFVPPPDDVVPELLADLLEFCNGDDLPPVVQAAVAHAQFETIHPFVDGNGRVGRVLIHLVLRRRGLATRSLPPVSLVLATWSRDYVDGLTATRYLGPPTGQSAAEGTNRWIALFAAAVRRAVDDAVQFEEYVSLLQDEWRAGLGRVRARSATDLLLRALPGAPVLTVAGAAELIGRTFQAANEAIARLIAAGVLRQVTVGRRHRAFEAPALIQAFTDLERRLASPAGDTRSVRPSRRVPRRG
jgi:Fic family protein